jgi:CIC family chloride channel protein
MTPTDEPQPNPIPGPADNPLPPTGVPPTEAAARILDAAADPIRSPGDPNDDEDRLPRQPLRWLGLMVAAAIVGAAVGLVGVAFRVALDAADTARLALVEAAHARLPAGVGWLVPVAACAGGAGLACWLAERFAPTTAGSGIPRVEAVLRNHLRPAAALILPVKFFGGVLSIGSGLALGREGPTVQMGGTVGRLFGDATARLTPEPWTLIAAGAGAGLAVAFNAPLAAAVFVAEELIRRFSARIFTATLVACIAGTVVARACLGNDPDFHVVVDPHGVHATVLPAYLLLGGLAGLFGVAFNVSLLATLDLAARLRRLPRGARGAAVGAAAGLIAWFAPAVVGGGEGLAQAALLRPLAWRALLGLIAVRFALSLASYGSGAPGGIFAPLLALGAIVGNGFDVALTAAHGTAPHPAPYATVAMAACFTAVVRSPLTAVVLVLEMTGAWTLILPMMAASALAYAVPELVGNAPIYDTLRARDEAVERARGLSA